MAATSIPSAPRLVFRGKLQSEMFTRGALAMRDVLRKIEAIADGGHDHDDAAEIAALLERVSATSDQVHGTSVKGDFHRGVMLALADFLALHVWADEDASEWEPLGSTPTFRVVGGEERCLPPPCAKFFVVGGAPVSVQPDLSSFVYDKDEYKVISLGDVKASGIPISPAQFAALRRVAPKLPTFAEEAAAA